MLWSMVTSTKIKRLSFPGISTSENWFPEIPSTLILNAEEDPPANLMEEIFIRFLLLLYTLRYCVVDPMVVKTVSNKTVSAENANIADGSSRSASFLQALARTITPRKKSNILYFGFDSIQV